MKGYIDEYRDPEQVKRLAEAIAVATTRPWKIMEVCGGQTHCHRPLRAGRAAAEGDHFDARPRLPGVRDAGRDDRQGHRHRRRPGVIFCSFGDMLRVPGSQKDLFTVKGEGGDVRVVYSPLDAVARPKRIRIKRWYFLPLASKPPRPPTPWRLAQARGLGSRTSPSWCRTFWCRRPCGRCFRSPANRVQAFLAAGHVCTITGMDEYARSPRSTACRS